MRIAVAGGTGVVGRQVVDALTGAGHEAVVLSRASGVDLRQDAGLAGALEGVDVIIDAAGTTKLRRAPATAFFTEVTGRLQAVGAAHGVGRLVTLSIVGIDRLDRYGYYRAKLAQERAALAGPLPVTIVRATQFHEFPSQILAHAHVGPVATMPVMRVQPVAARSVGRYLMEVALDPPPEQTVELAGPRAEDLVDLARQMVRHRGRRLRVVPLRVPGAVGSAMRGGALLATPVTRVVGPSFGEWLAGADAAAAPTF